MNFHNTKMIFWNTIQKEMRSKTLWFLLLFTLIVVLMTSLGLNMLNDFIVKENSMPIGDQVFKLYFQFINFWTYFVTIFFAVSTIQSDFETTVISQLLSFPIKRWEYLLARVLGTWSIVISYYIFAVLLALFGFSVSSGGVVAGMNIIFALGVESLAVLGILALGVFFSLYWGKMMAFVSVIFINFIIFVSNTYFVQNTSNFSIDTAEPFYLAKGLAVVIHFIFPRITIIGDMARAYLYGLTPEFNVMGELIHFGIVFPIWALIIAWVFRRKTI